MWGCYDNDFIFDILLDNMPPKSARMRSGGIPPSNSKAKMVHSTHVESDPAYDFLAMIPSPVTFPAPKAARMRSGGIIPSPPKAQVAPSLPSMLDARDSAFDFMAMVPSPVTFSPPHLTTSGVPTTAALSLAQPAPPLAEHINEDPFAFLDMVPSPVTCLPSQKGQGTGTASHSVAATSPPSPLLPPPSQHITLLAHMGAGDSLISFMAKLESQNAFLSTHSDQTVDRVSACLSYSPSGP